MGTNETFEALVLVEKNEQHTRTAVSSSVTTSKTPPSARSIAGSKWCLNAAIGMRVKGFAKVDCLLVRKSFLSYLMPHDTTTATKMFINDQEYQVSVGEEYCLAVRDTKNSNNIYTFSLDMTADANILSLTIRKLPPCGHTKRTDVLCANCERECKSTQLIPIYDLLSGRELWRGNWGEVWAAQWCKADTKGVFCFSDPQRTSEVAFKRFFNVMKSLDPNGPQDVFSKDYIYFHHAASAAKSAWHLRGEVDPYTKSTTSALRACMGVRAQAPYYYAENPVKEVEIMQRIHHLSSQAQPPCSKKFVSLNALGICLYNLYVLSELLPGASLAVLLDRLVGCKVSEPIARHLMKCLLESVLFLHSHNIVHLDLKAENVAFRLANSPPIGLKEMVSCMARSELKENIFLGLVTVLIDFGQAEWAPIHGSMATSPTDISLLNSPHPGASMAPPPMVSPSLTFPPPTPSSASTAATAPVPDPLRSRKRKDVRQLGGILYHLLTGTRLPDDISKAGFSVADVSPEAVTFIKLLLFEGEYTVQRAQEDPWILVEDRN